jgi:hypothetical protein
VLHDYLYVVRRRLCSRGRFGQIRQAFLEGPAVDSVKECQAVLTGRVVVNDVLSLDLEFSVVPGTMTWSAEGNLARVA